VETLPMSVRPHVINPAAGLILSGNHLPIGSWYPVPLGLSVNGHGDTTRSWRLRELLIEYGPAVFTPGQVLDVHYDDVHPARREIMRAALHARNVLGMTFSPPANAALNILTGWYNAGAHSTTTHPYYAVAFFMNLQFRVDSAGSLVQVYGGSENGLCYFLKTLKQRLDANPLAPISASEKAFLDQALAAGWRSATTLYGPNTANWQAAFANGPGTLRVLFFNTRENFGSLDPLHDQVWPGILDPDGGTIWSQAAESYSQWVDLAAADSSAAILPTGASENPASPHFDDQAPLLVAGTLRPAPLSEPAVQAIAQSSRTLTAVVPLPGDLNDDGAVDLFDLPPFVEVLLGNAANVIQVCTADVDWSGTANGQDIRPFVELLQGF